MKIIRNRRVRIDTYTMIEYSANYRINNSDIEVSVDKDPDINCAYSSYERSDFDKLWFDTNAEIWEPRDYIVWRFFYGDAYDFGFYNETIALIFRKRE